MCLSKNSNLVLPFCFALLSSFAHQGLFIGIVGKPPYLTFMVKYLLNLVQYDCIFGMLNENTV